MRHQGRQNRRRIVWRRRQLTWRRQSRGALIAAQGVTEPAQPGRRQLRVGTQRKGGEIEHGLGLPHAGPVRRPANASSHFLLTRALSVSKRLR